MLSDEASCRDAASSRSLAFKGSVNYSRLPSGCFQVVNVFWNTNENGKRSSLTKAICKEKGKSITFVINGSQDNGYTIENIDYN